MSDFSDFCTGIVYSFFVMLCQLHAVIQRYDNLVYHIRQYVRNMLDRYVSSVNGEFSDLSINISVLIFINDVHCTKFNPTLTTAISKEFELVGKFFKRATKNWKM